MNKYNIRVKKMDIKQRDSDNYFNKMLRKRQTLFNVLYNLFLIFLIQYAHFMSK